MAIFNSYVSLPEGTIHGSYGFGIQCHFPISTLMSTKTPRLHRQSPTISRGRFLEPLRRGVDHSKRQVFGGLGQAMANGIQFWPFISYKYL